MADTSAENEGGLPLSKRMQQRTKKLHDTSDESVNLRLGLVLTSKPLYAEAISLFWPIYRELESLLEKHKEHTQIGLFYPLLPTIRRARYFEKDMTSLLGNEVSAEQLMHRRLTEENGTETFDPPELQQYIDHLRKLSSEDPIRLVPYILSMYGAIMAGGYIIKRMVKTAFSLKTNEGVEMFVVSIDESKYGSILEIRNDMKHKLNEEMELSDEEEEMILDEAPKVFIRNNALVATVQDTCAFAATRRACFRMMGLVVSVAVALLAMFLYYSREDAIIESNS